MDKKLVYVYAVMISLFIIAYPFLKTSATYLDEANQKNKIILPQTKCRPLADRNIEDLDKKQNKANIIFTMDDGWESQYTMLFKF